MHLKKAAAVTAAAVGIGLVGATSASAAGTAYNTRYEYLTDYPVVGGGSSCVQRTIYLAAGTYDWQLIGAPESITRTLFAGTFTWKDCITQDNGFYDQTSTISNSVNGQLITGAEWWLNNGSGWYTWGSSLTLQ